MKTDQLISALAADTVVEPGMLRVLKWLLPASIALVIALFFLTLGLRPDIAAPGVTGALIMKFMFTGLLALSGLMIINAENNAGQRPWRRMIMLAGPVTLLVFIVIDLTGNGINGMERRMIGMKGLHCLTLVPLFSALPLAAILMALRHGTILHPQAASIAAAVTATGIGASIYALNCMDDSPLFVMFWYSIAAAIVMATSWLAGKLILKW
ncbi:MAG: NrsF family protein [Beijerinckiaceae bacterium]